MNFRLRRSVSYGNHQRKREPCKGLGRRCGQTQGFLLVEVTKKLWRIGGIRMGLKKFIKQQIPGGIKQSQGLAALSDAQLQLYIPDVYQKDIYQIDYQRLWDQGIRLISFDIDDTIQDSGVDTWYKLNPTGKITTLRLHPFDSNQDEACFTYW